MIVLNHGLQTTIQDSGRRGFQKYGVPVAGVMDRFASSIANQLVGNSEEEAVLEASFLGPQLQFEELSKIAITGAQAEVTLNGSLVSMWRSFDVKVGDVLTIGPLKYGARVYIAFSGGIKLEKSLNSYSTYVKAGLGGLNGKALSKGNKLELNSPIISDNRMLPPKYIPSYNGNFEVNLVLGPQDNAFTDESLAALNNSVYKVTADSDRMGYRLDGVKIIHKSTADIISDGIVMGSVQVPGSGQPIIMMSDRQTTGGYTKIATVISTDLWKIAQSKPGDTITFKVKDVESAQKLYIEKVEVQKRILDAIRSTIVKQARLFECKVNNQKYDLIVNEIL